MMEYSLEECAQLAAQGLKPTDTPAVVFYDTHTDMIIAESCGRFCARPHEPNRYIFYCRVPKFDPQEIANDSRCAVVDIYTHADLLSDS